MSDEMKKRKIDLRLTEDVYEEITLVGWVCGKKRSGLLRMMIGFFIENAKIRFDDQNLAWHEVLEIAHDKQLAEEVMFEEICERLSGRQTLRQTGFEVSEELGSELQVFAEIYAKNAIEAFKKHAGGRNDG